MAGALYIVIPAKAGILLHFAGSLSWTLTCVRVTSGGSGDAYAAYHSRH
jgi:hypothetical protein